MEQAPTGVPLVYTYVLDPVTNRYRDDQFFSGGVKASVPFVVEIDLTSF